MSTTFCTWSIVLVETNSNPTYLGEEVDLMEMDGIKSNPAWHEIEVDNLMGLDKKSNLILLGKKQKSINQMKMDETTDWMNKN